MTSPASVADPPPPESSFEVRKRLVEALRLDLVGPWSGHPLDTESLLQFPGRRRPSNWYLTGFIVPPNSSASAALRAEVEVEARDGLDETPAQPGTSEESTDEGKVARRGNFPSSIGLSFLVDGQTRELSVTVRWGDYVTEEIDRTPLWSRIPRQESTVIHIPVAAGSPDWEVPGSRGLNLHTVTRPIHSAPSVAGTSRAQSVSLFLLNRRKQPSGPQVEEDTLYAFQPEIEVSCARPFPSKPVVRSNKSRDWEEEVQNTIKQIGKRKRYNERWGLFRDRLRFSEVVELTSRVSTAKVAEARRLLGNRFRIRAPDTHGGSVDCAIATNMISVGLDIPRFGLMTVIGQPKTAAEYIQATSRVGRDADRPGLVVTLLNMHKPRDRSHYERFKHFHETFYRAVEVASVTPFAARTLDRGLAGALVALARQSNSLLTPPRGAGRIKDSRADLAEFLQAVFSERTSSQPNGAGEAEEQLEQLSTVRNRIEDLLDAWCSICSDATGEGLQFQYQKHERSGSGAVLLRDMMDEKIEDETRRKFRTNRPLRDVEPDVRLALIDS